MWSFHALYYLIFNKYFFLLTIFHAYSFIHIPIHSTHIIFINLICFFISVFWMCHKQTKKFGFQISKTKTIRSDQTKYLLFYHSSLLSHHNRIKLHQFLNLEHQIIITIQLMRLRKYLLWYVVFFSSCKFFV